MRQLIKNGTVYDGSGKAPFSADLLLEDDKILAMEQEIDSPDALVIDASGMAVTPGFVDIHRHCDLAAVYDSSFGQLELAQGLTTVISGNCGLAPVPTVDASRQELYNFIEPCLGVAPSEMKLCGFGDYIRALEGAAPKINVGGLAATGAIKVAAKGFVKTPFTQAEMDTAIGYVKEAMEAGAFGLSMGIMYNPECYSSKDEFVRLVKAAAPYSGVLCCHIRGEGNSLLPSVEEIIDIAGQAGVALNISHFKSTGLVNWNDKIFKAIERVETARSRGQDVTVDFYPYTGGSTTLLTLIPPTALEDDLTATLKKLSTRAGKEQLKTQIYREYEDWDNMVTAIGWERIVISSVTKEANRRLCGKNIKQLAAENGYGEPSDFICDLLAEEEGKVGIIVLSMSQEDVDTVAKLPYSLVISDSLYGKSDSPHPRLYGSFPKIIREYVKERKVLSMEQAVQKMTSMPAQRMNLSKRGVLAAGNYADINIFDPNEFRDRAVYENSKQLATGMRFVFVNGAIAWHDEKMTAESSAKVLIKQNL